MVVVESRVGEEELEKKSLIMVKIITIMVKIIRYLFLAIFFIV